MGSSRGELAAGPLRSNSFNLVPDIDISWASGQPCPLLARDEPESRARTLWLRLGDRLRRARTSTGDFSDDQLLQVKDVTGQLYLDISRKLAPDDFAQDLRKLIEIPACTDCQRRATCGGAWAASSVNVFNRDEEHLLSWLRELSGVVVDVGCGEGPYAHALAERARSGDVEYIGIDPDQARIDVLRSRYPWGRYEVGTLEQWAPDSGVTADHVLILRSYNHLPQPAGTVAVASSLLAAGGTLTVVDNVAFGLVRKREAARQAEASDSEFEHYRNDTAADAHEVVSRYPFLRLHEAEVGPRTSNQWLLLYKKQTEAS